MVRPHARTWSLAILLATLSPLAIAGSAMGVTTLVTTELAMFPDGEGAGNAHRHATGAGTGSPGTGSAGSASTGNATSQNGGANGAAKVTICHATSSETNPFVEITIATEAVLAHMREHDGDVVVGPGGSCPQGAAAETSEATETEAEAALGAPLSAPAGETSAATTPPNANAAAASAAGTVPTTGPGGVLGVQQPPVTAGAQVAGVEQPVTPAGEMAGLPNTSTDLPTSGGLGIFWLLVGIASIAAGIRALRLRRRLV